VGAPITLTAGALFGAPLTGAIALALVGFLFDAVEGEGFTNQRPVFLADLDAQGNFAVPEGKLFLELDAYIDGMSSNNSNLPTFVAGPGTVPFLLEGKLAIPFFGPNDWIVLSEAGLRLLAAEFANNEDNFEDILSLAVPATDLALFDGSLAGEAIASSVLEQISGFKPGTVTLDVTTPLTVAQAVALEQAGFNLADNATFSVRDFATTVQAANASPAQKLIMLEATQVTLVGNELGNSVDLMAFDRLVKLRLEAGAGDDQLLAGRANDVIVGQAGADHITLTTQDVSSDTIVYQNRFDGGSLPVTALRFAQDSGSGENITNYYREGSQLQVSINGVWSDYTMTGEDTAQGALQKLANEIMRENRAIDPAEVLVGFLVPSAFSNTTDAALFKSFAISNPVMLAQFDAAGRFKVPAGFKLMGMNGVYELSDGALETAGGTYQLTGQHIVLASTESATLHAGYGYVLGNQTNGSLSVRWDAAKLLAAEVQPNNTINLVGAQVDTVISLGGEDNVEIDNPGQATVRTVMFSGEDGQYVQDDADHKLSVTISFDHDSVPETADKQVTVEALIVDEDASDSVAALVAAINANTEVNNWVTATVGEDGTVLTLTGDRNGLDTFSVSGAEIDTHGAQQKTSVSFSNDSDDYYAGGKLSVTVAGKNITADMVAGDATASVAALLAKVGAALDPTGDDHDTKFAAVLDGVAQGVEATRPQLTFTAKEEAADPLEVSAQLGYAGVAQQASATFSGEDGDYYEGGELSLTIDTPDGEPVTISADMVAGNKSESLSALANAVTLAFGENGSLSGVISLATTSGDAVRLTAASSGSNTFSITEASTTVAPIKQVTQIDFLQATDDQFIAGEDGDVSVQIAGHTITADLADTKAGTLANLKAAIEAAIEAEIDTGADEQAGSLFSVLGSVSLSGEDVLTLTAKNTGADPLNVSKLRYDTPDLTESNGVPASRPHTVLMNFNNTTLDNLNTGDKVRVTIDNITTTVEVGPDKDVVFSPTSDAAARSTLLLQVLMTKILSDHPVSSALASVELGFVSQGVFTPSGGTPGNFDTALLLTAKVTGPDAYQTNALGEVETSAIGITITKSSGAVANPGSTELVHQAVLVWSSTGSSTGVTIHDENGEGSAVTGAVEDTLADADKIDDALAVDNTARAGEAGGVFTENAEGGPVLNDTNGQFVRNETGTGRVDVNDGLVVGAAPDVSPQGDAITVQAGFDPFYIDGRYLTLALGAEADVVRNFQVDHDFVALEGALLQSTLSGEDVDYADGEDAYIDLNRVEFGVVDSWNSDLDASELSDVSKVVDSLNDVFYFGADFDNGILNTTVFAITAEDDRSQTALWVHKQSSFGDNTVTVDEMSLLAIVHTIGGEFGFQNFLPEPTYQTMPA
jgi:hypothetical protein